MKDKPIFFISFIGRRDPRNNGEDGPILTLLKQKDFINTGRVLLLYTSDMEKNAEETSKCIVKLLNLPPEKVEIRLLEVSSPVDWEEVYNKVKDTIIDISDLDKYNCYLNLSSGTPQMQGSFFLIGMSGVIEAELIYQPDPKFSKEPKKINRASTKLPYILPRIERSYRKEEIDDELDRIRKNIGIIGENPLLIKALKKAQRYARGDENILIKGESGTGKELFARLIHELSNRAKGPFKSINCAAIPEQLLESELFGYKKGAFTGANRDYPGLFKVCDKGTIFLDEIGDLSLNLQAKLLRAVENKEIKHLGDENIIKVDVRIITATHKNLEEMVREGKFREDLYYRIGILTIPLPALREREKMIYL
jgi:transcriptional regulator with PAS, ATPase and Fis domain